MGGAPGLRAAHAALCAGRHWAPTHTHRPTHPPARPPSRPLQDTEYHLSDTLWALNLKTSEPPGAALAGEAAGAVQAPAGRARSGHGSCLSRTLTPPRPAPLPARRAADPHHDHAVRGGWEGWVGGRWVGPPADLAGRRTPAGSAFAPPLLPARDAGTAPR